MNDVKAIGFDFFNTLMTIDPGAVGEAWQRLTGSLGKERLPDGSGAFP